MPTHDPTGILWEEYLELGALLERLHKSIRMLKKKHATKNKGLYLDKALVKIRYELDEFVFADFPQRDRLEKIRIFYQWKDECEPLPFPDALPVLSRLRDRLSTNKTAGAVLEYIANLIRLLERYDLA